MAFEKHYKYRTQRDNIELLRRAVESIKRAIEAGGGGTVDLTTVEALLTAIDGNTDGLEALITTTNSTLTSILNSIAQSQDFELNLVRDTGNGDLVVQEIKEYDQGTGTWNLRWEDASGNPYIPSSPANLVYMDPTAVLNLMLTELQTLVTNTNDVATETTLSAIDTKVSTEAKQDAIIAELQNILAEPDYEILECYGHDSSVVTDVVGEDGSTQSILIGAPGLLPLLGVTPGGFDDLTITQFNDSYAVQFDFDADFTAIGVFSLSIDWSVIATSSGLPMTGITFDLVERTTDTVVDTTNSPGSGPGATGTIILNFDNTIDQHSEFALRITPTAGVGQTPATTFYDNFLLVLDSGVIEDLTTIQIRKVDRYEDNVLISTTYFDKDNNPYTLIGSFIKDDRLQATSLLNESLADIQVNTSELQKLTSHNTVNTLQLNTGTGVFNYTNFKRLTFTVVSGTPSISVGAGPTLVYPIGPIAGQTIEVDDTATSTVSIDTTNGTVLVTVNL
jgi:hypothetical protein